MQELTVERSDWTGCRSTIAVNRTVGTLRVRESWYWLEFTLGPQRAWNTCVVRQGTRRVLTLRQFQGETDWMCSCNGVLREGPDPYVVAAQVLFNVS